MELIVTFSFKGLIPLFKKQTVFLDGWTRVRGVFEIKESDTHLVNVKIKRGSEI